MKCEGSNRCCEKVKCLLFKIFFFFFHFRAVPVAYGSSHARGRIGAARGRIGAVAADLNHSHSHTGSKLHLGLHA